jgi:hypothetical protein
MTLLAICMTLYPMRIDETIYLHLREKFIDKLPKPLLWVGYVFILFFRIDLQSFFCYLELMENYHFEIILHMVNQISFFIINKSRFLN